MSRERARVAVCTLGLTRTNVSANNVALLRVGKEKCAFDACLCSFSISLSLFSPSASLSFVYCFVSYFSGYSPYASC